MLLTLAANTFRSRLVPKKGRGASADALAVTDLPRLARESLGLFGLHLTTPMLAGADLARLDAVRDAADKAPCPCLSLTEPEPQPLCTENDALGDAAIERMVRVVRAANRLGCNAVGLSIAGEDVGDAVDFCIERLRRILVVAERLEVNLLVVPIAGLTAEPDRLTDLIKRVGGFRVGTFPDFETASKQPDPQAYLRRIVPYAAAVTVACQAFKTRKGALPTHESYDLVQYVNTLEAIGYTGTLAIDYRGPGDPIEGVRSARELLDNILSPPVLEDDLLDEEGLDDLEDEDEAEDAEERAP